MLTTNASAAAPTSQWSRWLVFLLAVALLGLAPLIRGGNRQAWLAVLLPLALALLAVMWAAASHSFFSRHQGDVSGTSAAVVRPEGAEPSLLWRGLLVWVGSSPVWMGLLQLMPIGASTWAELAGHAPYLTALGSVGTTVPDTLALSLVPSATWAAVWSAFPVMAVFFSAFCISHRLTEKVLLMLLLSGLFQTLLGFMQIVQGPRSTFYFDSSFSGVIGTFNNRNHLADYLAMLAPVWAYFLVRNSKPKKRRGGSRNLVGRWLSARTPLWLFSGFVLLVTLLATRSRGGLIAVTVALVGAFMLHLFSVQEKLTRLQKGSALLALVLFASAAVFAMDVDALAKRFAGTQFKTDAELRNLYTAATLEAARAFWPWGSGMGTFEAVFPRFQPLQAPGYVPHAHNDYSQLLMELGAAGLLVALGAAVLIARQIGRLWLSMRRVRHVPAEWILQCSAGLGLFAFLLHSWVEFNMHIPALAITAGFLAGVFLRPVEVPEAGEVSARTKSRRGRARPGPAAETVSSV